MIKSTPTIDRMIAAVAGLTTSSDVAEASGRQVPSVRAAEKRGLVKIIGEYTAGLKTISFELTDLGIERAVELEELYADPKTGKIPFTVLINL